jgi:hypothetical protein
MTTNAANWLKLCAFSSLSLITAAPGSGQEIDASRNALVEVNDPFGEQVNRIAYLSQNWSPRDSERFYFTSQGSQVVPYAWFLALEQPDNGRPFRAAENIARFRYLTQKSSSMNPDGLPVGFVKDEGSGREWLGFTCAACHTAQVDYQGVGYRIDGGPAMGDVRGLLGSLTDALKATRDVDAKFDRFAAKVLGAGDSPDRRVQLRDELTGMIKIRDGYHARNFPANSPGGYARVDALGAILNEVFHRAVRPADLSSPTVNTSPADAPVSYPFLWDTPQHDRVQWIGTPENGGFFNVLSLGRNVGEVLGVFADFEIPEHPGITGIRSSVRVSNLQAIEEWLRTLWSPQWPSDFPAIDGARRDAGRALFATHCANCHRDIDRKSPQRSVVAQMGAAGTDRRTFDNFFFRTGASGKLEGANLKVFPFTGRFEATAQGEAVVSYAVIAAIVGSAFPAPADALTRIDYRRTDGARAFTETVPAAAYKGRPLNGIWATAPYLHNGSVPTLYDLLLPPDQRPRTFQVGSRRFDPQKVGFVTNASGGFFEFRTHDAGGQPIPGNSNAGHEYGAGLSVDQRWQIVEYLKSL